MISGSWQDLVLGAGQLAFAVALIPALRAAEKPPLGTSVSTALLMVVFAGAYLSLGLVSGAGMALVMAALWGALAWQRAMRPAYAGARAPVVFWWRGIMCAIRRATRNVRQSTRGKSRG